MCLLDSGGHKIYSSKILKGIDTTMNMMKKFVIPFICIASVFTGCNAKTLSEEECNPEYWTLKEAIAQYSSTSPDKVSFSRNQARVAYHHSHYKCNGDDSCKILAECMENDYCWVYVMSIDGKSQAFYCPNNYVYDSECEYLHDEFDRDFLGCDFISYVCHDAIAFDTTTEENLGYTNLDMVRIIDAQINDNEGYTATTTVTETESNNFGFVYGT